MDRSRKPPLRAFAMLCLVLIAAACARPREGEEVYDPYEPANRQIHQFNVDVDRAVVRPAAKAYGEVVPNQAAGLVNNFAFNFSEPRNFVNGVLQGRIDRALNAGFRFAINTTVGIGGLFDPATMLGLQGQSTDFGETLYVWGFKEGAYVELPLVGPSTQRHTVGRVADLFMNPLTYVLPYPDNYLGTASSLMWALDTREEFGSTLDDIMDNSADSYAQARILYLQNRRHKLGDKSIEQQFDPFQELGLE